MSTLMTRMFRERCANCQVGQGRKCPCRDAEDQTQGLTLSMGFRVFLTLIFAIAVSAALVLGGLQMLGVA